MPFEIYHRKSTGPISEPAIRIAPNGQMLSITSAGMKQLREMISLGDDKPLYLKVLVDKTDRKLALEPCVQPEENTYKVSMPAKDGGRGSIGSSTLVRDMKIRRGATFRLERQGRIWLVADIGPEASGE
jgi:hypothetical protein